MKVRFRASLLLGHFVFRKVEASNWWWPARDHGKGTSPPRLPLHAHLRWERDVWVRGSFRAIWETWATPPNISCFLNGKVRFWSVYVFFIKKKIGVKNKGTILFTNHFDLGWKENSLIKIDWDPVELFRKTVMISTKPRLPHYSLFCAQLYTPY